MKDLKGELQPKLIASNDIETDTKDRIRFFVRRWRVEVTFQELRRHLGLETQRQSSDLAIRRTTPVVMGLFSIVCLLAQELHKVKNTLNEQAAWYQK